MPSGDRHRPAEDSFGLVHAAILRGFPALVRDLGGNPEPLLDAAGLVPADCDRPRTASYRQWIALMRTAADKLGTEDFGMRLALRQGGAAVYGDLGTVMRNSPDLGSALAFVAAHNAAHSCAARVWKAASPCGEHVFFGHDVLVEDIAGRSQAIEQVLLLGHLGAQEITGSRVRARRVHFRHGALSPAATYRRNFGCEVRFCRAEDGLAFSAADMACPVLEPDPRLHRIASARIESFCLGRSPPLALQVRAIVMQRLCTPDCGNESIARDLAIHPRTLHRRLKQEGTSFRRIKDEVRRDTMRYYLEHTDMDLTRLSWMLGFAEQSALSHFARQVFGSSPRALRSGARQAAD